MKTLSCAAASLAWTVCGFVVWTRAEPPQPSPPTAPPPPAVTDGPPAVEDTLPPAAARTPTPGPDLYPPPPDWEYVSRMTMARFPEEGREELSRFLQEIFPDELQSLKQTSRTRPERAMEALTDLAHRGKELLTLRQSRPELYAKQVSLLRLERQAEALGANIRRTEGEARKQRMMELQRVLAESFAIKQELMKEDLEDLLRGVQRLRTLVEKREEHRQVIIRRRLMELTGNEEWTQW